MGLFWLRAGNPLKKTTIEKPLVPPGVDVPGFPSKPRLTRDQQPPLAPQALEAWDFALGDAVETLSGAEGRVLLVESGEATSRAENGRACSVAQGCLCFLCWVRVPF